MRDLTPLAIAGLALIVAYWVWLWAFFTHVRPQVMAAIGRRLGIAVRESANLHDGGTMEPVDPRTPFGKHMRLAVTDFAVVFVGVIGVAALLFVPAFLVGERGMLLPLEGRLTGRIARLAVPAEIEARGTDARLPIDVRNEGNAPLVRCRIATQGYSARSGFVHGASPSFDLAATATRSMVLELGAGRAVAGRHELRIDLECDGERLASAGFVLVVH